KQEHGHTSRRVSSGVPGGCVVDKPITTRAKHHDQCGGQQNQGQIPIALCAAAGYWCRDWLHTVCVWSDDLDLDVSLGIRNFVFRVDSSFFLHMASLPRAITFGTK